MYAANLAGYSGHCGINWAWNPPEDGLRVGPLKPGTAPSHPVRLMDQVRERIRYLHYSLSTEKPDLYWIRFFIH